MSYASNFCDSELGVHQIDPCLTDREFGRTRSGGFVKKGYLATLLANPTSQSVWQTGLDSGDIIILPDTAGTFDPGEPKALKGYGDIKEKYGPREMTLTLIDPDYKTNYPFYNGIKNQTNLVPFYRTSSLVHIFDSPGSIDAKDAVEDDLESEVVWEVTCKVTSANLPTKHSIETIKPMFDRLFIASPPTPATFDTLLEFSTAATDSAAGVSGTASATDADQKFEFNAITPRTGTPASMNVKVGGTLELVVDYTTDYSGQAFKYTDKAGTVRTGTFVNGDRNF